MKKFTLIIAVFIFTITGCKKTETAPENSYNFVGTKWIKDDIISNNVFGGNNYHELRFININEFEILERKDNIVQGIYKTGTYTYADSIVTLKYKDDPQLIWYKLVNRVTLKQIDHYGRIMNSIFISDYIKQD